MSKTSINITMGIVVGIIIAVIFFATCFVYVGSDEYVLIENWRSEGIEALYEKGIYFRPFSRSFVYPEIIIFEYSDRREIVE